MQSYGKRKLENEHEDEAKKFLAQETFYEEKIMKCYYFMKIKPFTGEMHKRYNYSDCMRKIIINSENKKFLIIDKIGLYIYISDNIADFLIENGVKWYLTDIIFSTVDHAAYWRYNNFIIISLQREQQKYLFYHIDKVTAKSVELLIKR